MYMQTCPALDAVIAESRRMGVDRFAFLGDAVGYGPYPVECVERLAGLDLTVALCGNHDHAACWGIEGAETVGMARKTIAWTRKQLGQQDHSWLAELEREHIDNGWMAVHGAPVCPERFRAYVYVMTFADNLEHLAQRGMPVCFHGHSHIQIAYRREASGRCAAVTGSIVPTAR